MLPAEGVADRRENQFLRWIVGGMLAILGLFGGIVWNRTAGQVETNTERLRVHDLQLQRLELDAGADRRATAQSLAAIQQWLQAIGQRLNVPQPPPGNAP